MSLSNFEDFNIFTENIRQLLHRQNLPAARAHAKALPSNRKFVPPTPDTLQGAKVGAVCILLYPDATGAPHFPLIVRPEYEGVHSGQIAFPGGQQDAADGGNLTATALRETEEEIGVPRHHIEVLGCLSELYIEPSNFRVQPVVARINAMPQFLPDPQEVADILQVSWSEAAHPSAFQIKKNMLVRGHLRLDVPFYNIQQRVVWGASAAILSELLEVLAEG